MTCNDSASKSIDDTNENNFFSKNCCIVSLMFKFDHIYPNHKYYLGRPYTGALNDTEDFG